MPYNILLVDDDRDFREEFKDFFRGYRVVGVGRGSEALEAIKRPNEFDLVVLDVQLPDSPGTEILKKIKQVQPDLGVIILTGFGSKKVVIEALHGAADEYLEKPLDIEKTRAAIEKILQNSRWPAGIEGEEIGGKIERVKVFLRRNVHKKVTLEEAAGVVLLSPKYLSRVFKEIAGKNFNEYKLEQKIAQAKKWLAETGHSVDMISYSLGYLNEESFIRLFKKSTGMTPAAYRKARARAKPKRK